MAVTFKVRERKVLINGSQAKIRYAQAVKSGEMDMHEICDLTGKISAVSEGDILSILNTVTDLIINGLSQGRTVVLGELGRFRISLSSKAAKEGEEFTTENIRKARVIFFPGTAIRRACKEIRIKAAPTVPTQGSSHAADPQPQTPGSGEQGSSGGGL